MILVGDIGGTHTRLALFENGKKVVEHKFSSKRYESLEQILEKFQKLENKKIEKACFGLAGNIRNGKCKVTNLCWSLDEMELGQMLQAKVKLINDLEANAHGLKLLLAEDLYELQKGEKQIGNQVLISAGTGLGEAGLFWDGVKHHPFATEGGHTDFAARDDEEMVLYQYLKEKYGHVSYERVVSGPGLLNIFHFLIDTKREVFSPEVKKKMEKNDPAITVSSFGKTGEDAACKKALEWFISLYGAEVGNAALQFMAIGGIYIGGGIAPHILGSLKEGDFLSSFRDKGRFSRLLQTIPIWVVLNDDTGLIGAAAYAEGI